MLGCKSIVFSLLEEIYSETAVGQSLSCSFSSECSDFSLPVPCIPNRGRPFSPCKLSQPSCPATLGLRPSVCLLCDHCPEGVLCLSLLPSSLPASFSLMRRDRYGRGGRRGTCLSKPAVENEGSDEGGMLCILNAQTPARGGGVEGWGYINRLLLKER